MYNSKLSCNTSNICSCKMDIVVHPSILNILSTIETDLRYEVYPQLRHKIKMASLVGDYNILEY